MRALLVAVVVAAAIIAVLIAVTRGVTFMAFHVTGDMPPSAAYLVINILASMVAAGLGGYVCTKLAPEGRLLIASLLLSAVFLAVGWATGRAAATPAQPLWFQALATLLGFSGLFCGLVIGASQRAKA